MSLTDEQLMLLEQITYIKDRGKVEEVAGVQLNFKKGDSVRTILSKFDKKALDNLRNSNGELGGAIEGKEWAGIIEAMQNDKDIANLVLDDVQIKQRPVTITKLPWGGIRKDGPALEAYAFKPPGESNQRIVTYKGTNDLFEWANNPRGIYQSETIDQKGAENYLNRYIAGNKDLDITVVGHSNGGNKAMHVAINVPQVVRAVAMDGQGFGIKYLEDHQQEMHANGHKITAYNAEGDFVSPLLNYQEGGLVKELINELLNQQEGIKQVYVKGFNVNGPFQNHCSNALLKTDEHGNLLQGKDGNYVKVEVDRPLLSVPFFIHSISKVTNYFCPKAKANFGEALAYVLPIVFNEELSFVQQYDNIKGSVMIFVLKEMLASTDPIRNIKRLKDLLFCMSYTVDRVVKDFIITTAEIVEVFATMLGEFIDESIDMVHESLIKVHDAVAKAVDSTLKAFKASVSFVSRNLYELYKDAREKLETLYKGAVIAIKLVKTTTFKLAEHIYKEAKDFVVNAYHKSKETINDIIVASTDVFIRFAEGTMKLLHNAIAIGKEYVAHLHDNIVDVVDSTIEGIRRSSIDLSRYLYQSFVAARDQLVSFYSSVFMMARITSDRVATALAEAGGEIKDFTIETYNTLIGIANSMKDGLTAHGRAAGFTVNSIINVVGLSAKYVSRLFLYETERALNNTTKELSRVSEDCKTNIDRVFNQINEIDSEASRELQSIREKINNITSVVNNISCGIGG